MPLLLPEPEQQFLDGDGAPYAGGTVTTYIPGTDTPKDTWRDEGGTILNANPIVLDAAGRAIIYGDGDYRLVLRDVNGLLVYDQLTDSVISDAMLPVVGAATIDDAVAALGLTDLVQDETDRATAAESTLTTNLNAEITRATTAEAAFANAVTANNPHVVLQAATASTDSTGHVRVTFATSYSALFNVGVVCTMQATGFDVVSFNAVPDHTGFDCWASILSGGSVVSAGIRSFSWFAIGETE